MKLNWSWAAKLGVQLALVLGLWLALVFIVIAVYGRLY